MSAPRHRVVPASAPGDDPTARRQPVQIAPDAGRPLPEPPVERAPAFDRGRSGDVEAALALRAPLRGAIALAVTLLIDRFAIGHRVLVLHGLGDAVGHALTALIWTDLAAAAGAPLLLLPAIIGALGIDLDHLPLVVGLARAPAGTSRPVTHSLLAALALLVVGAVAPRRRRVWWAAALGVASHLVRDLGTGAITLWWPVAAAPVSIPYSLYVASTVGILLLTASLAAIRRRPQPSR